ncbi:hypothetical protein HAX54_011999 [Datura stramonium]|uniref:Uncharacterized protein n=1 Tax=Datura stramonium TaxID=4076 RepID=A0ABS8Y501_DATST|nr:hypothetical protein [Datura stramonium]
MGNLALLKNGMGQALQVLQIQINTRGRVTSWHMLLAVSAEKTSKVGSERYLCLGKEQAGILRDPNQSGECKVNFEWCKDVLLIWKPGSLLFSVVTSQLELLFVPFCAATATFRFVKRYK